MRWRFANVGTRTPCVSRALTQGIGPPGPGELSPAVLSSSNSRGEGQLHAGSPSHELSDLLEELYLPLRS